MFLHNKLVLRLLVPMVAISLTLFAMGSLAAWNIQRQQVTTQNTILREVEGVFAVQRIYVNTVEVMSAYQKIEPENEELNYAEFDALQKRSEILLQDAAPWPQSSQEKDILAQIDAGYKSFWTEFRSAFQDLSGEQRNERLDALINVTLVNQVRRPASIYIQQSHDVMERANEASKTTTDLSRQGFLLIGFFGCAGGLVAGIAVARAIRQTLIRLDVSVRGVADQLGIAGHTVTFSQEGSVQEMMSGLREMEQHVTTLVERVQKAEIEILRNEQLAALGQLAAGMAHEIRNPLMPIKLLVQSALSRPGEHGLTRTSMEVIVNEIKRLEETLQTFLDFARPQQPFKSHVKLMNVIEQTKQLLSTKLVQQDVTITCSEPIERLQVYADESQLRHVLLNLFLNSIDAMPQGGQIAIDARASNNEDQPYTSITVCDTGTGFPEHVLHRVFEPFVTTKETGTGLGLSICQRIIQTHGGTIEAANSPTGGAVFTINFPSR